MPARFAPLVTHPGCRRRKGAGRPWHAAIAPLLTARQANAGLRTASARRRWALDAAGPIVVLGPSEYGVVTVPAELARVSVETARRAVVEYVTAGRSASSGRASRQCELGPRAGIGTWPLRRPEAPG